MTQCKIDIHRIEEWARQQCDMKKQIVTHDGATWRLDADSPAERLRTVGGLDISFLEIQARPNEQRHSGPLITSPDAFSTAAREDGDRGAPHGITASATTTTVGTATTSSSVQPKTSTSGVHDPTEPTETCHARVDPRDGDNDYDDPDRRCSREGQLLGPGVAALVVLSYPDLRVLYEDYEPVDMSIPYLPGYLGFRECDAYGRLLKRVEASPNRPQVLMVDGCGLLHPRGCGSACQVGVTCGYPTVGIAKNLLAVDGLDRTAIRCQLQEAAAASAADRSSTSHIQRGCRKRAGAANSNGSGSSVKDVEVRDVKVPLVGLSGTVYGMALCPGLTKKPLYISVGHRLSLNTAVELVRRCCLFRIPEPIRQADLRSRQWLRDRLMSG